MDRSDNYLNSMTQRRKSMLEEDGGAPMESMVPSMPTPQSGAEAGISQAPPSAGEGAIQGASMGSAAGPQGAMIGAGAGFLMSYMQAKAAAEAQKKALAQQNIQNLANRESAALSGMQSGWARALT